MMMLRIISLCLTVVQCCFLCVSSTTPVDGPHVAGSFLRLVTYNTGLATSVGQYEARRTNTGPAVAELDADVTCLQEVWYSGDMEHILHDVGPNMYSYSALHDAAGHMTPVSRLSSPCMTSWFVFSFLPCLTWRCDLHSSDKTALLACAEQKCGLLELEQQCITCLIISDRSSLFSRCFRNLGNQVNIPGLLLISKRPITNARLTYYRHETQLLPRARISAEVDGVGTVVCTHLTADISPIYYEKLPYDSWASQNLAESQALVSSLEHVQHAVVMGDTNSGPGISHSDVKPSFIEGYNYITAHGFRAPYVERVAVCTYCGYNRLSDSTPSSILDHVFTRGITVHGARRVIDGTGVTGGYSVSDHFGIEVTIEGVTE